MATLEEYQKKIKEVKVLHVAYHEAQSESNTALARYKQALVELEEL